MKNLKKMQAYFAIAVSLAALSIAYELFSLSLKSPANVIKEPEGPVAYYPFENNLFNVSRAADLEPARGKSEYGQGFSKKGLLLEPGDLFAAESSSLLLSPLQKVNQVSLSFWLKPESITSGSAFISKLDGESTGLRGFAVTADSKGISFFAGGLGKGNSARCAIPDFIGSWRHIALTSQENGMNKIYADGLLCGEADTGTRGLGSESHLIVGGADFKGVIDELKIWKGILTPESIKILSMTPSKNPSSRFGIDFGGFNTKEINELNAMRRVILRYDLLLPNWKKWIELLDGIVTETNEELVITFVPSEKFANENKYYMPEGKDMNKWISAIGMIVERYDGLDNDFGCKMNSPRDCYESGDFLFPTNGLILQKKPVHNWQITNEPLVNIMNEETLEPEPAAKIAKHFREAAREIRSHDPNAVIIAGGIAGLNLMAPVDGYGISQNIEIGKDDCEYQNIQLSKIHPDLRNYISLLKERTFDYLREIQGYYDILDIHLQIPTDPYEAGEIMKWLKDAIAKENLHEKPVWSLKAASPMYFHTLMEFGRPEHCSNDVLPYDQSIQSKHLVKLLAIGLSSGIEKIFISPMISSDANATVSDRLSLAISDNGKGADLLKKPAFFAYKQVSEKLKNMTGSEKINGELFKFTFRNKPPVFIAWSDKGVKAIDMSGLVSSGNVRAERIVTGLDQRDDPIFDPEVLSPANTVYIGKIPVIIVAAQ